MAGTVGKTINKRLCFKCTHDRQRYGWKKFTEVTMHDFFTKKELASKKARQG